jgi:hypothetical protein
VNSVSNVDGSLTIAPNAGSVVASLNLANPNTFTALQQFNGNASTTQFTSTGATYLATAGGNVGIGTTSPGATFAVNGNSYINGSETTNSLLTSGNANVGSLTVGSLSGILKANSGVVSTSLVNLNSDVTNTLPVANGGTGSTTLTGLLKGNGTGGVQTAVAGTDYQAPGAYLTALTGDGSATGPGSATFTLATVNTNTGVFGSSTAIPTFTVNGKGLITAAGTTVVVAPAGTLTGTTLASNVVSSSLTSVGTLTGLTVNGQGTFTYASTTQIGSTGSAYFATAGGSVGIGSTTPGATLGVNGSGLFTGALSTMGSLSSASLLTSGNANVGSLTIGSLSGILKANSGVVSTSLVNLNSDVTNTLPVANGGTGLSTTPTYGQLLLGTAGGSYALTATSSLGLVNSVSNVDGSLTIAPNAGSVVASLNLANPNTFTALQQFNGNASTTQFTSTGATYLATAGGNVGIGTTSPYGLFSVGDVTSTLPVTTPTLVLKAQNGQTGDIFDAYIPSGTTPTVRIDHFGQLIGSNFVGSAMALTQISSINPALKIFGVFGSSQAADLAQFVKNGGQTYSVVNNYGQFALGTTSTPWELDVATSSISNTFNNGQLGITDTNAGTNLKHWLFSSEGGNLYLGTTTDSYATTTIPVLSLLNAGFVGVGTTSPLANLSAQSPVTQSSLLPIFDVASSSVGGGVTDILSVGPNGYKGLSANQSGGTVSINGNLTCNSGGQTCGIYQGTGLRMTLNSQGLVFNASPNVSNGSTHYTFVAPTDTAILSSADASIVVFNNQPTRTHLSGAIAQQDDMLIQGASHAFFTGTTAANAVISTSSSLTISGIPRIAQTATARGSIVNTFGLLIASSTENMNEQNVAIASTTNSYGLGVQAVIGATNNYAAEFLGGNVGIGTSSPLSTLTVSGSACFSGGVGATLACGTTPGSLYYKAANTGAYDVAENYETSDLSVVPGTIVALDTTLSKTITTAKPGAQVFGVVSTDPGLTLGGADSVIKTKQFRAVALSGRVPVRVTMEGGPIAVGDRIALSSVPGVGMKATQSGQTVGIALAPASSDGTVDIFVQPQYSFLGTDLSIQGPTGAVTIGGSTANTATSKLVVNGTLTSSSYLVSGVGSSFASDFASFGRSGTTASSVLSSDGKNVDLYKLATFTLSNVQALASQTDALASTTNALSTQMQGLTARVTALEAGANAGMLAAAASSTPSLLSGSGQLASALEGFGVLLQNGVAQFNTLVTSNLSFAKDSNGSSAAGSGTVLAGNTTVMIQNPHMYATSQVSVTLTAPFTGTWYVSAKRNGSFQVTLSVPAASDITFDYLIVQTGGQIATTTPTGYVGSPFSWLATLFGGSSSNPNSTTPPAPAPEAPATGATTSTATSSASTSTGTAPTVTLNGSAALSLSLNDLFTDPGATAKDASSTDISSSIVATGTVDTATPGIYTITYTATDAAGNKGTVSRVVTVSGSVVPAATPTPPATTTTPPPATPVTHTAPTAPSAPPATSTNTAPAPATP